LLHFATIVNPALPTATLLSAVENRSSQKR